MNQSKIILLLKVILSIGFLIVAAIGITSEPITGKTVGIIAAVGLAAIIVSFVESAGLNKQKKEASELAVENVQAIENKNKEIEKITTEIKENNLLAERIAKLSKIIQEAEDVTIASNNILETLAEDIEICQGVVYVAQEKDGIKSLKGKGTYAYHKMLSELDEPQFGVGLVGQAALENKSLFINELPSGYIDVVSGLGKSQPSNLAIIPLTYSGSVLGVIELASFIQFSDKDKELFEGIKDALGAGIHFLQQSYVLTQLKAEIASLKGTESLEGIKQETPAALEAPIQSEATEEEIDIEIDEDEVTNSED